MAGGDGEREFVGKCGVTADRYVSFWGIKNVPKLMVVVVGQLCEYTESR